MIEPFIAIGFWQNKLDTLESAFPHPLDFSPVQLSHEEKSKVIAYLNNGIVVEEYMGFSYCRIKGGPPEEKMGCSDLSDGKYVWPEGFSIYVDLFNVPLPDFFLSHIRDNNYTVNSFENDLDSWSRNTNYEPWLEWSKKNKRNLILSIFYRLLRGNSD